MTMPFERVGTVLTVALLLVVGAAWAEEEGGQCQLPGDGVNGPPLSYRAESNGTVIDLNTGLIWEMKDGGSGIHSVNRTFTWSTSAVCGVGITPDGTAFTVFLDTLNNRCEGDELTPCSANADCRHVGNGKCGYAGHRDWRMPNIKELQSIVDYSRFQPAIDPTFGPTRPSDGNVDYWSFTTYANSFAGHEAALFVNFDAGSMSSDCKETPHPVRAVRDGEAN